MDTAHPVCCAGYTEKVVIYMHGSGGRPKRGVPPGCRVEGGLLEAVGLPRLRSLVLGGLGKYFLHNNVFIYWLYVTENTPDVVQSAEMHRLT